MWKVVLVDVISGEVVEVGVKIPRSAAIEVAVSWSLANRRNRVALAVPCDLDVRSLAETKCSGSSMRESKMRRNANGTVSLTAEQYHRLERPNNKFGGTGRTTACMLRCISHAIETPNQWQTFIDHRGEDFSRIHAEGWASAMSFQCEALKLTHMETRVHRGYAQIRHNYKLKRLEYRESLTSGS